MHKYQCASMFNEQHQDMDCQPAASTIPTSTTILKTGYPLLHLEETFILDWVHQNNIISRIKKKYIYIYIYKARERERQRQRQRQRQSSCFEIQKICINVKKAQKCN